MLNAADPLELMPDPQVARVLGVSLRTLARWDANPELGFPLPTVINRRKFRRRVELDAWVISKVAKVAAAVQAPATAAPPPPKPNSPPLGEPRRLGRPRRAHNV